ncbi:hypothetical protein Mapa_005461 [Marchantia paleacea]|nr:hypothetical protein Mapa_005461 [Marchantia paleacea]
MVRHLSRVILPDKDLLQEEFQPETSKHDPETDIHLQLHSYSKPLYLFKSREKSQC